MFRGGRVVAGKLFRCLMSCDPRLDLPAGSTVVFGVAVPSRVVRRAVDRNRIKRLVRESYRLHKEILRSAFKPEIHQPVVLIFVYSQGPDRPPRSLLFVEIEHDIVSILSRIQLTKKAEGVR